MAYIDKNIACDLLAKKALEEQQVDECAELTTQECLSIVRAIPTVDVEEVKHGTWYHGMENGSVYAKCSACGRKMNYSCYGYARCSLCGAKMDGVRT